ncbi:MAG: M20/M25/M40 family metallo-hydrolase [Phycisphaeraceae bacterium]|nr:MAG: M20/M25/M40 family metallo-hydrolase [Phycisphaeraceae bacterium]
MRSEMEDGGEERVFRPPPDSLNTDSLFSASLFRRVPPSPPRSPLSAYPSRMSSPDRTARSAHETWLRELTSIPTAAGREDRVIAWVENWTADRADLALRRDEAGNLVISIAGRERSAEPPILFTAHLDHPAFHIDRVIASGAVEASFRGGVMAPYFEQGRVIVHTDGARIPGVIVESEQGELFRRCVIELEGGAGEVAIGDIATWDLPDARIEDGMLHAPACDDLAAVAAALSALDELRTQSPDRDIRILLTRAEEVGFIGAIAACRLGTIPAGARVIALENSRSFAESPIGAGPIIRVGDRLSTFDPTLTSAIGKVAERLAGHHDRKVGDATPAPAPAFLWQRKLMPGGACEATAFCAWGYTATCLCLPLGNYHNMGELDRIQEAVLHGEKNIIARIAPEYISIDDYHGLIDLLIACGESLGDVEPVLKRLEKLYEERAFVLGGAGD